MWINPVDEYNDMFLHRDEVDPDYFLTFCKYCREHDFIPLGNLIGLAESVINTPRDAYRFCLYVGTSWILINTITQDDHYHRCWILAKSLYRNGGEMLERMYSPILNYVTIKPNNEVIKWIN